MRVPETLALASESLNQWQNPCYAKNPQTNKHKPTHNLFKLLLIIYSIISCQSISIRSNPSSSLLIPCPLSLFRYNPTHPWSVSLMQLPLLLWFMAISSSQPLWHHPSQLMGILCSTSPDCFARVSLAAVWNSASHRNFLLPGPRAGCPKVSHSDVLITVN